MIAEVFLVIEGHALFALAGGHNVCAIQVDCGACEEGVRLASPHTQSRVIDDVRQDANGSRVKAAAEVPGRGGVWDAFSPQSVQVVLIVATQFDILQASAVTQSIVSDVEDMIRFVIGHMEFE